MQIIFSGALMAFFLLSSTGIPPVDVPAELSEITEVVESAPMEPEYPMYSVKMTGYNAVPEQTNEDPMTTASGARSNPETIVARSRDLAEQLPYGTIIEILPKKGITNPCGVSAVEHLIGYRIVADTMHPRKKNQIDIMFETGKSVQVGNKKVNPAVALGVCNDIEIRVVGYVDIQKIPKSQMELAARIDGLKLALRK